MPCAWLKSEQLELWVHQRLSTDMRRRGLIATGSVTPIDVSAQTLNWPSGTRWDDHNQHALVPYLLHACKACPSLGIRYMVR